MELTYTERNGIFYPNLTLPEQTNYPIGKYGRMRLDYLNIRLGESRCSTLCEFN